VLALPPAPRLAERVSAEPMRAEAVLPQPVQVEQRALRVLRQLMPTQVLPPVPAAIELVPTEPELVELPRAEAALAQAGRAG